MRWILLSLALLTTIGCASPSGELVFCDHNGKTLATGQIDLPADRPGDGQTFEGPWHLRSAVKDFPISAPAGRYRGQMRDEEFSIDLTPNFADHNLILTGAWTEKQIQGVWSHSTFAGPREGGTFSVIRGK